MHSVASRNPLKVAILQPSVAPDKDAETYNRAQMYAIRRKDQTSTSLERSDKSLIFICGNLDPGSAEGI